MKIRFSKPWLKSPAFDLTFILLPSIISVIIVFLFADTFRDAQNIPLWAWLLFIIGIDVAHVYSTLFRTYFNSNEFKENKTLLTIIPLSVWLIGVGLFSINSMLFWRVLAYVAVFHFIRQQYGFLRLYTQSDSRYRNYSEEFLSEKCEGGAKLYSEIQRAELSSSRQKFEARSRELGSDWVYMRKEIQYKKDRWLSALVIYFATLYPILFWHSHERNFHWFIDGDFLTRLPVVISNIFGYVYLAVLALYFINELLNARQGKPINIAKNAIVIGTAASWYIGIVHFNGDMAFTITNVVSHGIPYMALVWLYGERQKDKAEAPLILGKFSYKIFFSKFSVPLFLATLLLFGYLEEGLWAGFVWRDHLDAFAVFSSLPAITAKDTLCWLVPLLTLPQATHYVLDGFIWKIKDSNANWQKVLFAKRLAIS